MPISIVTGGAGFIGSHLVDLLVQEGHSVRIIDNLSGGHSDNIRQHENNQNVEFFDQNINEIKQDSEMFTSVDYCFHLAGIGDIVPSIERPVDYMETNVQGTVKVLEASRHAGIKKLVYASSSSCYGLASTPTDENHSVNPEYPYALSKYLGEQTAFHWNSVYGLPVNSICIFNAYGTRVRTTGAYGAVFGVFFKQKLADKPFTIVGDGEQKRDFVYVTDVAKAFLSAALINSVGQRFNIGAGKPQSVNKLAKLVGENKITYIPKRPGEPEITYADIKKARSELNWSPMISFEDGVGLMMEGIDHWKDAPLWDKSSIEKATESWFKYLGKK
jgi:UDP-glucose 4-epimerase